MLSFGEQKSVYFSVFYTVRWLWEPAVIGAVHLNNLFDQDYLWIRCNFLKFICFLQASDQKPVNRSWSVTSDAMWNGDYLNCSVNFMIHICSSSLSVGNTIFNINACDYDLWICFQCIFCAVYLAIAAGINKLAITHWDFSENIAQHIPMSTLFKLVS